ncbi:hypothetical protein CSV86_029310 [Pseudomonas putida CSV86]|uniref:Uncharacterized protein n=1 Tax=Pseudomonas bharatica CSV86 TaxID=1005395 RepID=A0A7K4EMT0_9PSED|nr:hypothetical protein [Pseudomonas bharatica CSV86]
MFQALHLHIAERGRIAALQALQMGGGLFGRQGFLLAVQLAGAGLVVLDIADQEKMPGHFACLLGVSELPFESGTGLQVQPFR